MLKVREAGRVVGVHALIASGVNADGHREILGVQVSSAEDGAGVAGVLPRPDRPRPDRVRLVTSDAHAGLVHVGAGFGQLLGDLGELFGQGLDGAAELGVH